MLVHACDKVAKHRRICHFIEADRQSGVLAFWTKRAPMAWRRPSTAKATYNGIGPDDERRRVTADRTALRNRRSATKTERPMLDSLAILEYSLREGESPCSNSVVAVFGGWPWF